MNLLTKDISLLPAHWVITNVYSILRPFISPNTQSKINLFGSNQDIWKAALRENFPPESIPEDYGGTGASYSALFSKEQLSSG